MDTIHIKPKYSLKKTIIYVGGFILPDGNAAAHRVIANAKCLRELGYNVVFLGVAKDKKSQGVLSTMQEVFGFQMYHVQYPNGLLSWLKYLVSISELKELLLKYNENNIESIIAYNYPSIALLRLKRICSKQNIALISDVTEWAKGLKRGIIISILKNIDTYLRMKIIHPRLDGIIAISKYLFQYYNNKIKYIIEVPPLVDLSDEKWNQVEKISTPEIRLVYAGSPGTGAKDRLDLLVRAVGILRNKLPRKLYLRIIGVEYSEFKKHFKTGKEIQFDSSIQFLGRLSHKDTLDEIKRATFSIFIRDDNIINNAGFPTKFVESISCGTPVLTNSTSNISDFLQDNRLGYLIDTKSLNSIVESILVPLSLPTETVNEMKDYCYNSRIFDYIRYLHNFECFMNEIGSNKG